MADETGAGVWRGQVYAERLGEYRDAQFILPQPDELQIKVKVGLIRRTLEWVRVDGVPAAPK